MTHPKLQIIQNAKGQWHWRLTGRNGKIIAIGGETFKRKPTWKQLYKISLKLDWALYQDKLEYIPKKKKR